MCSHMATPKMLVNYYFFAKVFVNIDSCLPTAVMGIV